MVVRILCDRCGKNITHLPEYRRTIKILTPTSSTQWDLCPSCLRAFDAAIHHFMSGALLITSDTTEGKPYEPQPSNK